MFSNHLPKIRNIPAKPIVLIAAGVVIVAQLVALVLLADGQVEKAQIRQANQASARAASALCAHSARGAALNDCDRESAVEQSDNTLNAVNAAVKNPPYVTLIKRD